MPLDHSLFVEDAVIFDRLASRSLVYGEALCVSFPDMPHLGIWTKPGAGYGRVRHHQARAVVQHCRRDGEAHQVEGEIGAGAGEGPTASAVMSDVLDIARGTRLSTFGQPASTLKDSAPAQVAAAAPYYLRMELLDKPGALAKITAVLGEAGISISRMRQYGHDDTSAPVLIVTHKTTRDAIDFAIGKMPATAVVNGEPIAIRIEEV